MTATLSENDDKNFGGFLNTRTRGQEGAVLSKRPNVTTTRSVITTGLASRNSVLIRPMDGDIFVGDVTVTAANGYKIAQDEQVAINLRESVDLYAIAESTVAVALLEVN